MNHAGAEQGRKLFNTLGIKINSSTNGVKLSWSRHHKQSLHSNRGVGTVNIRVLAAGKRTVNGVVLSKAARKKNVIAELDAIKAEIKSGSFRSANGL